jgi:putative transposase
VDKLQKHINLDKGLEEIPSLQRRPTAMTLENYQICYGNRDIAIVKAYQSGGYTLKEIGQYYKLHYSTVSGIIKNHKSKT